MPLILHYHAKILSAQIRAEEYLQTVGNSYLLNRTIFETLAVDFDKRQLFGTENTTITSRHSVFQCHQLRPLSQKGRSLWIIVGCMKTIAISIHSALNTHLQTAMSFTCKPCFSNMVKLGLHVTVPGQYPLQLHDVTVLSPTTS